MPQPTLGDVHVNRPLTNLSIGFVQDQSDFVAGQVFPSIPVNNRSDVYFVYNRGDFFRNNMQKRAPGTPAASGGYKLTTQTYVADVWSLKKVIDDQIRANSDAPLQPDRDATYWLTQQALVNRDVNWVASYFTTGVWGTDITGVASGTPNSTQALQWDKSGSTPIEDVLKGQLAIKSKTGMWPNVLVLGAQVFMALLTNGEITDRLKYGQTAPGPVVVNLTDLAALFKVSKVVVAAAIQTTSAEDTVPNSDTTPDTFDFIAGKNAGLFYASPSPGIFEASAGYTFNWTGFTGATAAGMRIKKYRWEIDSADHVEIDNAYAFGLVSKYLGYFYSGLVS
jgi:hypothetical protein